ncbi:phosphoribosyl-ATP pyrophosphatase [Labrys miyagiensis]|uniref:Phosphoribosyl-ATP pyrophosphatase n=1 Tax=Labrys miyagiensis TaxID=346912 RepID=A0ABQ6CSN3_9HYPH|nr:phosphoribosyl-ATP diphosphatase [Labrys miyagiensis]GLS23308.1 phosphoribosyl-ATP pyrophosphatase [Labrys miyagiensis]
MSFSLADLEARVAERAKAPPEQSWTARLLAGGPSRAAKKFGEEAVELVIALAEGEKEPIVAEAADVLYHLLVGLRSRDVTLDEVMLELERRTGLSGLAEKAARPR